MFVESYRILHDRPVADALFEGERLLAQYEIEDEHRLALCAAAQSSQR